MLGARLACLIALACLVMTPWASAQDLPAAGAGAGPRLGMDAGSAAALKEAGAPPAFASYWVGPWMATSGWGGLDAALQRAKAAGAAPVVYWYYWGDSISPTCVEYGCNGRTRAQWDAMTATLVDHLRAQMGGAPVFVVLENEFNKNGITATSYAPTFDAHLAAKARELKALAGVHVVLGFGAWGESEWSRFPQAIEASDSIGFQLMRASTKDSEASYRGAVDRIAALIARSAQLAPTKGTFLYDLALSSYPEATHEPIQAQTLASILARWDEFARQGLGGIVYRELTDNPSMGTHNYYGVAEQSWGLRTTSGAWKPAWAVWRDAGQGPGPAAAPGTGLPADIEGESMMPSTGGRVADASASGGAVWNLWSNGELAQRVEGDGAAYEVTIVARGSPAGGVWPTMHLRVDGAAVASWEASGALAAYRASAAIAPGATLLVAFSNDAVVGGEDRNLYVDVVRVARPPPNAPPVAAFEASGADLSWAFDASASSDPEGAALAYAWDLGDGASATGRVVAHTYATAGARTVTLTVTDPAGLASSATREVVAVQPNRAPVASAAASGAQDAWTFDASGSWDHDPDALAYAWSFSDGASATGARVSRTFAQAGEHAATVTVTDARGLSSSATVKVVATIPPFAAGFGGVTGNDWWVQTSVSANKPVVGVCAIVDASSCRPLTLRAYGWAASFFVPAGSVVTFRATASTGEVATSSGYVWPRATPVPTVVFTPHGGNEWWVQTRVDATAPVKSVCASVNGGACQTLTLRSWGSWAQSLRAPVGSKVVFQASFADGYVAKSAAYAWPVR